jgi:hypothetical protein
MRSSFSIKIAVLTISLLFAIPLFDVETRGVEVDAPLFSRSDLESRSSNASEWNMYMGDPTHKGFSPSPIPLENDTDILWGQRIDNLLPFTSPVIWDGIVYLGTGTGHM